MPDLIVISTSVSANAPTRGSRRRTRAFRSIRREAARMGMRPLFSASPQNGTNYLLGSRLNVTFKRPSS